MEVRERELNRRDVRTVAGVRYALPVSADFRIELLNDCLYEITIDTGCGHA